MCTCRVARAKYAVSPPGAGDRGQRDGARMQSELFVECAREGAKKRLSQLHHRVSDTHSCDTENAHRVDVSSLDEQTPLGEQAT